MLRLPRTWPASAKAKGKPPNVDAKAKGQPSNVDARGKPPNVDAKWKPPSANAHVVQGDGADAERDPADIRGHPNPLGLWQGVGARRWGKPRALNCVKCPGAPEVTALNSGYLAQGLGTPET